MAGEEKLVQGDPSPWEAAATGLQLIAATGEMWPSGSIRRDLLTDAEGFLGMLQEIELHGARLPDTVNSALISFSIDSNNLRLLDHSLRSVNAFTRFDALNAILIEMGRPGNEITIGEDLWAQLYGQANDAVGEEVAIGDMVGTDFQFTVIARSIADLRLQISRAAGAEELAAVTQSAKELIANAFDIIDTEPRGNIESLAGKEFLVTYLTGQFDQICGENGMWRLMFNQGNSVPYLIYKSAAGELDADELDVLEQQAGSHVKSHALEASAILAAGQLQDEDERFKLLMRQSQSPLFSRHDSRATNAFRWANPELWAYSVGRPSLGINNLAALEYIIDADRPDLMPAIRERYSDVCRLAASKNSAMIVLGFAMALQMTRSAYVEPGESGNRLLGLYLAEGERLQSVLHDVTPADTKGFTDEMAKLLKWVSDTWPGIDPTTELRAELVVLETASSIVGIDEDVLQSLRTYVQSHWLELQARRSQSGLVADLAERAEALFKQAQEAVLAARAAKNVIGPTIAPGQDSDDNKLTIKNVPGTDEPYL
ncbi:MAG TPA: hypothetical protein VLG47_05335 [Candidatus Saccharimonadales bacterium]|nr:hypothetical protein [Candidatus Saccharimonadales bacterium]